MEEDKALPKTIIYSLNPNDNTVIAAMSGNFQGGGIPGKDSIWNRMVVQR